MSLSGALITVAVGASVDIPLPGHFNATACVLANESDLLLQVSAGGQTKWISAWTQDIVSLSGLSVGNKFTVSPQLIGQSSTVSSIIAPTFYGAGEPIAGTYPSPLVRQVFGNLSNQTLTNDGNGRQIVIEMTVAGNTSGFSNIQIWNDGTIFFQGLTSLGFATLFEIFPGNPSSVTINGDNFTIQTPQTGTKFTNSLTAQQFPMLTDATNQLNTGHQETGFICGAFNATAGGQIHWEPINFKNIMTNIPSSVTLSGTAVNCTPSTFNISRQGCVFQVASTAAGVASWFGTYSTVGN